MSAEDEIRDAVEIAQLELAVMSQQDQEISLDMMRDQITVVRAMLLNDPRLEDAVEAMLLKHLHSGVVTADQAYMLLMGVAAGLVASLAMQRDCGIGEICDELFAQTLEEDS
jgi:hypothetical protein